MEDNYKQGAQPMGQENIIKEFTNLHPEAQRQVEDFIAFLQTRYQRASTGTKSKRVPLKKEPFIGMWKDREEMKDSATWVRTIRKAEWREPRA